MIPDQPLVSIITPVFNGARFIEELILSVREQDYPHIEHIIIDDGSNDNGATVAILRKYPHLRWWSREIRGQYATMNEGLRVARGEIVCFVNADDLLVDGAVTKAIQYLSINLNKDAVYGLAAMIDENSSPYPIEPPFRTAPLWFYPFYSQVSHCSLYIPKKTLIELGLYFNEDLKYVSDYDWIIRLNKRGINIGFLDISLSKIRIHSSQISQQHYYAMIEEQKKVYTSHGVNRTSFWFFTSIYIIAHDFSKLKFATMHSGWVGAFELIINWIKKRI